MIGIWPEAWLRLHDREREVARVALTRSARVARGVMVTAPAAVAAPAVTAPILTVPDLACC